MSAPESWKAAYRELIGTIVRMGYPEEFGKLIARNLGSEKTMRPPALKDKRPLCSKKKASRTW